MFITDNIPNITYISIGSRDKKYNPTEPNNTMNCSSTQQQFPPCLHQYFGQSIKIFMIDKVNEENDDTNLEATPSFCQVYDLESVGDYKWIGDNIEFTWLQGYYNFENCYPKELIEYLEIIWKAKQENPEELYLVFMHDFSGHGLNTHEQIIRDYFDSDIFNTMILFNVQEFDLGCYVDLEDTKKYPEIIDNYILNVYVMNPLEIAVCFYYKIEIHRIENMLIKKLGIIYNNDLFVYRNNIALGSNIIIHLKEVFKFLEHIDSVLFYNCWPNIEQFLQDKNNIYKVKDFINNGYNKLLKTTFKDCNMMEKLKISKPESIILTM
jgi:hypothetical protein